MPAKAPKKNPAPKRKRAAGRLAPEHYEVVLREQGGAFLKARVRDDVLYPQALAWNRLLVSNKGRQNDESKEARAWRNNAHAAILDLAESGDVRPESVLAFIKAAAASGVVQVEMNWTCEETGYAARIFPWEALLALATKDERERAGQRHITVVRVLKCGGLREKVASGAPVFVVTDEAKRAGFDYQSECAAVRLSLDSKLAERSAGSLKELDNAVSGKPRVVHLVMSSVEGGILLGAETAEGEAIAHTAQVAAAVSAHSPALVAFSSCYTGRRLAPQAVAAGARVAIGFQDEVADASCPVFFGAFYQAWVAGQGTLESLRLALEANRSQPEPDDLGTVTIWSATDILAESVSPKPGAMAAAKFTGTGDGGRQAKSARKAVKDALPIMCTLEAALNYSVLHNSRGGLFKDFVATKIMAGPMEELEVTVSIDTGLDRPAVCHFFVDLPDEAYRQIDLAKSVALPLGSQLLRQRGEMILGTVEVSIKYDGAQFFHQMKAIKVLPCDEWRDDKSGRHLLPSFVFPRDPAVRQVLTAAQPFLRALTDQPQAGFDGYQCGFSSSPADAAKLQARAIWAALQHPLRLDYVNPPPAYTLASQRLRTPEEILRGRRGTCIELALLLASCWEHVGIFPVIFLTSGHSFAGYWTSESARTDFIDGLDKMLKHAAGEPAAKSGGKTPPHKSDLGGTKEGSSSEPWMLSEPYHLAAIRGEVAAGRLVAVEATFIPLQRSFEEATRESAQLLGRLAGAAEFDGMLDVQTAREKGITPLAIISEGVQA